MESVPPAIVMSSGAKSVDVSESVKVRVAVSPALRDATLELMEIVGGVVSAAVVSTVSVTVLSASLPS